MLLPKGVGVGLTKKAGRLLNLFSGVEPSEVAARYLRSLITPSLSQLVRSLVNRHEDA
jgi:hypothetical protein